MRRHLTPRQLVWITAIGIVLLIAALTIVRSRHSEEITVLKSLETGEANSLIPELARCRTITADETVALESCRRLWAKNRREFFKSATLPQSPIDGMQSAPAAPVKSQDRILPGEVSHPQEEAR
jgi:conjugative transfer region protein TrbK